MEEQKLNRIEVNSAQNILNEGVVRFLGGTDNVVKKLIFRLADIRVVQDEEGNPHYEKGNNPILTDEGLNRIMFFIEGIDNEAIKLSNQPSENAVRLSIRRTMNELARDFVINAESWFVDWKKDLNHTYEILHQFTKASFYDSLNGFKTKKITQRTDVKETSFVSDKPQMEQKRRPSFLR